MTDAALLDRPAIELALIAAPDQPLIIAFSGGGDSHALLLLCADALGAARLHAVIVDHGLRDGSAAEAQAARETAAQAGVSAEIVRLSWPAGAKPMQADARTARYRALCAAARGRGASAIALGHTRDDQAETVLLRAQAQSGWRGLAGMAAIAPAPLWPEGRGLCVVRPLLKARRADLRAYLRDRGACWVEDPSNANPAFARVRARAHLAALEATDFDAMRLAALAENLRPRAESLDYAAYALVGRAVRFEGPNVIIQLGAWAGDESVRQRALAALLAAASGQSQAARPDLIARLDHDMQRPDFAGATAGGARLLQRGQEARIGRDRGALLGRADGAPALAVLPLEAGREQVWDGRIALTITEPGWQAVCGLGSADPSVPILEKGETRLKLAAAEAGGLIRGRWLLADHVAHVLNIHPVLTGPMA